MKIEMVNALRAMKVSVVELRILLWSFMAARLWLGAWSVFSALCSRQRAKMRS
jgi:hypothetical protein